MSIVHGGRPAGGRLRSTPRPAPASATGRWVSSGWIPRALAATALAIGLLSAVIAPASTASAAPAPAGVQAAASGATGGIPVGMAPRSDRHGFWTVTAAGVVTAEGDAPFLGDESGRPLAAPVVGMAATPDGGGYWLVASDGGIFTFGDAHYLGSTGGLHLNQPIVGMAATPDDRGYWLVASDGGIFTFGDAPYLGSTGGLTLNSPIVGMAATPDGRGYWLVASDGGIFTFGDAHYLGSTGGVHLDAPVVGMAPTSDGDGYRLLAADGGIFDFGDAGYVGSAAGQTAGFPALAVVTTGGPEGYWVALGNGQVASFGSAPVLVTPATVSAAACAGNPTGEKLLAVSIAEQQLWACDGSDLVSISPVTTGASALRNVHDATPTGTWRIQAKTVDVTLNGCDANGCWHDPVHFWMPFDGAYGFHDAPWQTFPYGSPAYLTAGSHGCVHLPGAEMAWVYAWAPVGTAVRITP